MTGIGALRNPLSRNGRKESGAGAGVGSRFVKWGRGVATAETSTTGRVVTWMLAGLAGLALWIVAFGLGLSQLQESHAQHDLYATFRAELALGTAPLGGTIARGQPVVLLSSAAGGIDGEVAVEGTSSSLQREGPGHLPGTPLPGQPGTAVLMGRSSTYGGPFGSIDGFAKGDVIAATTGEGTFHYVVVDIRRAGDPLPAALPAGGSRLTLVTSDGSGWRSGFAPSGALYVDAALKGKTASAPSGSAITSPADLPMARDTSGLYPMILWLQLLVLAAIGMVWASIKWGRWQAWIVGVPILLVALWGTTSEMWLLLPNLV